MIETVALVALVACGLPYAAMLVDRAGGRDVALIGTAALGLALGAVTQALFWQAMIRPGTLGPRAAMAAMAAMGAGGRLLWRARRQAPGGGGPAQLGRASSHGSKGLFLRVMAWTSCAAILVNAAAWPFADGDALAVYGPLGRVIAASGSLPAGEGLYEAYPQHVPLLYALIEWLRGAPGEEGSRLWTAAYAVGCIVAAGGMARDLRSPRAGLIAAALLAATPVFCRWASSGYADVPAGFYVVMAAWLAWRWWVTPATTLAAAAGIAAGLAMWTKNSTLTLAASSLAVPLAWWWTGRRDPTPRGHWPLGHLSVGVLALLLVALPWYARNLVAFGVLVPPTAWTDQARPILEAGLVVLRPEEGFGVLGGLLLALPLVAVVRLARAPAREAAQAALVLGTCAPFVLAWWWFASYDPRFLVTVLPVAAAYAGVVLDGWLERVAASDPRRARFVAVVAAVVLAVSWTLALRRAVEHKGLLPRVPWMDDTARHRVRVGGLYEIGRAVDALPAGTHVAGVPVMARYYIRPARLIDVAWERHDGRVTEDAGFVVISPVRSAGGDARQADASATAAAACDGEPMVRTIDGYVLCRRAAGPGVAQPKAGDAPGGN